MIFLWPNAGGKLWIVEIHQGYALSVLRRHWVLPRRSANEPALSSLDYLGLGNEENGLYTSCTYINMSVFMCIYIFTHICIHLYIYSLIHFLFICFFLCFFWFWLIYFFKRAHQERKQERGACTNMYIYISTYHIYIYGFYVGQICIYIFYIHWLLYMYMWLLSLSLYICIYIYIGTYTPQSHHTSKSQPLAADLSNHPFKWNSITNSTKKNIPSVKSFWGNVLSNPT